MNFSSGSKILQKGACSNSGKHSFVFLSMYLLYHVCRWMCAYVYIRRKKKIQSETLASGKSKCSVPHEIGDFLILLRIVSKNKSRESEPGCTGRQGCLGSQLWCAGLCLRGLMCRHCPAVYFIHTSQRLLQQVICWSELKQCLQMDSSN